MKKFPESNVARRAANEIGLLYYQDDKYPEAIQAYKQVIASYPGSEEARLAQRDLKSIYIDLNKVDEYANFASTIPGGANFDVNERDSLTYVAAERVYMRGEVTEARNSFTRYLQTFPEGAFSLNANYYIGLIDYNQKAYESAARHLDKVLEYPNNKYSEDAMLMGAEMAYMAKDYEKALHIYKQLKDKAASMERRQLAKPECYAVRICWEMRKRLSLPQQICWPILNWRRNCLTRHIITVQSLFGCRQDGWSYGRSEDLGKRHP